MQVLHYVFELGACCVVSGSQAESVKHSNHKPPNQRQSGRPAMKQGGGGCREWTPISHVIHFGHRLSADLFTGLVEATTSIVQRHSRRLFFCEQARGVGRHTRWNATLPGRDQRHLTPVRLLCLGAVKRSRVWLILQALIIGATAARPSHRHHQLQAYLHLHISVVTRHDRPDSGSASR